MQEYYFKPNRTDLILELKNIEHNNKVVEHYIEDDNNYKTIIFDDYRSIKNILINELNFFLNKYDIKKTNNIFIVGLGNDNYTADSIGPKVLKHIKVSEHVKALEPGVLGETGIKTARIVESVSNEIKPDIMIIIDSFVSNNIDYLNRTIELTDAGIKLGSGIFSTLSKFDRDTMGIPVIGIGVTTAVEVKFIQNNESLMPYILSLKDIDSYVSNISELIGDAINQTIDNLK